MRKFDWENKHKYVYWGITAFCVIICAIMFFMLLERWTVIREFFSKVLSVLSPIIWGLVIAYLLSPATRFFEEKCTLKLAGRMKMKSELKRQAFARALAVSFSVILLLAIIISLIWLVIPQLYTSIENIVVSMPEYVNRLIAWVEDILKNFPEIEESVVTVLDWVSDYITNWLRDSLMPQMNEILSSVTTGIYIVVRAVANFFIGVVISVYMLFNKEKFLAQAKKTLYSLLPEKRVRSVYGLCTHVNKAFTGFITGKLLDSILVGLICYIGCVILNMPYQVLIAVIIGITNIIPFFGPFIGAIPTAVLVLMVSPFKCLVFIIFIILLQQFDGNILGPKILGNTTGLNGFWIIFAILIGAGFFGFAGMILGVPVFAVIYSGIKYIVGAQLEKRGYSTKTESYMGIDPLTMNAPTRDDEEEDAINAHSAENNAETVEDSSEPEDKE